jgi:hypothetical protein
MPTSNLVLSSPFEYLQDPANANDLCGVLTAPLSTNWSLPVEQCWHYRSYIRSLPINPTLMITNYVIDKAMVMTLLKKNGGNIAGIRIYIGHEIISTASGPHRAVRLFMVPCIPSTTFTGAYDDFGIPDAGSYDPTASTGDALGDTRPCPEECPKSANVLNT